MAAKKAGGKAAPAKAAPTKAKKKSYSIVKSYKVEDGKLVKRPKSSPKKGAGYFMADHKDRLTCGSTGYMEKK
jgi:ubiquitin-small subunit ribosomal protein S27Ae